MSIVRAVENSGKNHDKKSCANTCATFVAHFDEAKFTTNGRHWKGAGTKGAKTKIAIEETGKP